jgi:hypothetical protein
VCELWAVVNIVVIFIAVIIADILAATILLSVGFRLKCAGKFPVSRVRLALLHSHFAP